MNLQLAILAVVMSCSQQTEAVRYQQGAELLKRVAAVYSSAKSLRAEFTQVRRGDGKTYEWSGAVILARPNRGRLDLTSPPQLQVLDGTRSWRLDKATGRYWRENQVD